MNAAINIKVATNGQDIGPVCIAYPNLQIIVSFVDKVCNFQTKSRISSQVLPYGLIVNKNISS